MDDVIIRPARSDELPHVAALAGKLLRMHHDFDAQRFILPEDIEQGYASWFRREIRRPEVVILVAARGDEVVGYTYARLEDRDWNQLLDPHGALHDLWVEPEARRSGVARRLVRATLDALAEKGAPRVVLHTAARNPGATAFFESMGFRRTMIEMTRESDDEGGGA
ncbi:MAG: GNAT family N-acetyltransferase [Byssovorax sp.]